MSLGLFQNRKPPEINNFRQNGVEDEFEDVGDGFEDELADFGEAWPRQSPSSASLVEMS